MVFIRVKKVKRHSYAYLVKSTWDNNHGKVKQEIIKYLGKSSKVTIKDIPDDFKDDPNIVSFIASHSAYSELMESTMKENMLELLLNNDIDSLFKIFEKYSKVFGLVKFYERLLKPVLYTVGELWSEGKFNIAAEHVISNSVYTLVKLITEKTSISSSSKKVKILLCTPEGEFHSIACNVIESFLKTKGYIIFNISPSVPSQSVITFADKINPDLIMISVTLTENIGSANRLVDAILKSKIKHPIILVGGNGVEPTNKIDHRFENVKFLKDSTLIGMLSIIKEITNDIPKHYRQLFDKEFTE